MTTTPKNTQAMSKDNRHCGMGSRKCVETSRWGSGPPKRGRQHCAARVATNAAAEMAMRPRQGHPAQTVRCFVFRWVDDPRPKNLPPTTAATLEQGNYDGSELGVQELLNGW